MGAVVPDGQLPPDQTAGGMYTHFLTDAADTKTVVPGAGGRAVVVAHDTLDGPGPSQTGVPGNERGSDAKVSSTASSDLPILDRANYVGTSAIEQFFASFVTHEEEDVLVESEETEKPPSDTDFEAQEGPRPAAYSALRLAEQYQPSNIKVATQEQPPIDGGEAQENRATLLTSTDPDEVFEALKSLTGFNTTELLNEKETRRVEKALEKLANEIAASNSFEGEPIAGLHSFDPAVVLKTLNDLVDEVGIDLDRDTRTFVQNTLIATAANSIAALNATSGDEAPMYPAFETLNTSTDKTEILETLLGQVSFWDFGKTEWDTVFLPNLQALAQNIAVANSIAGARGIESVKVETVLASLMELSGFEDNPALSFEAKALLRSVFGSMAENIASMNEAQWTQDTYSSDKDVIFDALKKLSNLEYDTSLSPEERIATEDYLKVLSMVMAFMSQIRTKMAQLDAYMQQTQGAGKLAETKNRTAVALESYRSTMDEIKDALEKIKEAKEKHQIFKVIMPIVGTIGTFVMLPLFLPLILFLLATWWIWLMPMLALTAGSIAVGQTNALEKLCDKIGVEGVAERALVKIAFRFLFFGPIITVLHIPYIVTREAMIAKYEKKEWSHTDLHIATTAGSTAFASGVVTNGIRAGLVAAGANDKDAEIAALILTLIMMMLMLLSLLAASQSASGAQGGEGFSLEGTLLGQVFGLAGPEGKVSATGGAEEESLVSEGATEVGSGLVTQMLQNLATSAGSLGRDPTFYLNSLDFLQNAQTAQGTGNTQLEKDLSQDLIHANTLLNSLTEQFPELKTKIEDIQNGASSIQAMTSEIIGLFNSMIESSTPLSNSENLQG